MNSKKYIWVLIFIAAFNWVSKAQDQVHLFTDRTSCVSGDTIWFNALVINQVPDNSGNVVHVQMDNLTNGHITRVSVVCKGNNADGYLPVPDSLSSGVYVLKAFTNPQKSEAGAIIHQRFITVYNRFETVINLIDIPQFKKQDFESTSEISLETKVTEISKINLGLNLLPDFANQVKQITVIARLADPLSDELGTGWSDIEVNMVDDAIMAVKEKNGVLINGRIYSAGTGLPKAGATVLLSISDTLPYLDYCIADEQGRFVFYLRNAVGTGNLVLQELTDNQQDTEIQLFQNYISTSDLVSDEHILTNEQRTFTTDVIKASYFDKFFNRPRGLTIDTFSLHKDFEYPFYGQPTKSFYPELFVDLDNFTEISREILRGVQYRTRKDEITIRMLDYGTQTIFNEEPFKLLDGIPVFDPAFFDKMGTNEIKKVDAVFYKRYFGDLTFSGVLAIYSNNPTLGWVERMPGMSLIRYNCLQPELNWNFTSENSRYSNIPDFKKVLLRQRLVNIGTHHDFTFDISDIEGDLMVEVMVLTKENKILQSRKVIRQAEINTGK